MKQKEKDCVKDKDANSSSKQCKRSDDHESEQQVYIPEVISSGMYWYGWPRSYNDHSDYGRRECNPTLGGCYLDWGNERSIWWIQSQLYVSGFGAPDRSGEKLRSICI